MRRIGVFGAWLADMALGEPPIAHPVRGMGSVLLAGRRWNAGSPAASSARRLAGTAFVLGGACACWWAGRIAAGRSGNCPGERSRAEEAFGPGMLSGALSHVRVGLTLSWVVSLRELLNAGRRVRAALERGDLDGARASLACDLVSRDTTDLGSDEVAGAAIQSLAENLNDAFVAPLFWALVAGPGAAYAYRWVNTADAVLGYRTAELEDFGWAAARSDDVLGWVPARLTAAAVVLAAPLVGGSPAGAIEAVRSSARLTPSPNGGWPMSAVAGALDVRLEKKGSYVLHSAGAPPSATSLAAAERLVELAGVTIVALALASGAATGRQW